MYKSDGGRFSKKLYPNDGAICVKVKFFCYFPQFELLVFSNFVCYDRRACYLATSCGLTAFEIFLLYASAVFLVCTCMHRYTDRLLSSFKYTLFFISTSNFESRHAGA